MKKVKSEFQKGFIAGQTYYMNKAKMIIGQDVAMIYAAAFIVLKREGYELPWPELAAKIQDLWNEVAAEGIDILDMCEKETGYEIRQGCITEDIDV